MKKYKKCLHIILCMALLLSSAIFTPIAALADDWGGGGNSLNFNNVTHVMSLVTSVQSGSTSSNRIRSIGWLVNIKTNDGRSASSVFERSGDSGSVNGYASYDFDYSYVINQFKMDAGDAGEAIARSFFYGTGPGSGGTMQMWAYFTWWRSGNSSNSQFNIKGAADGAAGSVSSAFKDDPINSDNPPKNYTPADVGNMFVKNTDSRFDGLNIPNGVATNLNDAGVIPTMWRGSMDLSDYYPATGYNPPAPMASNDLTINLQDLGTYRVDTDVIESAIVTNSGEADVTPSDNVPVHLSIPGVTDQTKYVIVPHDSSQLVYFKFHTPSSPGSITMTATVNANHAVLETNYDNDTSSRTVSINAFDENTPPDPGNNGHVALRAGSYFQYLNPPGINGTDSTSWGLWEWVNNAFVYNTYSANVTSKLTVTPDGKVPTALKRSDGMWKIKSGYGIDESVTINVSTSSTDSDAITGVQRTISYYPEFEYDQISYDNSGYFRILERLTGGLNANYDLQANPYSRFGCHVHFLPVWFADDKLYTPETYSFDVWTPNGMLSCTSTDSVYIKGSVFDDSQTGPVRNP